MIFTSIVNDWPSENSDRTPDLVSRNRKSYRAKECRKGITGNYNHNCLFKEKVLPRKDSGDRLPLFPTLETGDSLPPPYPLEIRSIPENERVKPSFLCRIEHTRSGYRLPGSFTYIEAAEILDRTREWDWTLDDKRRPSCYLSLLALLFAIVGEDSDRSLGFAGGGEDA